VADGKAYGIPRRDGRAKRGEMTTPKLKPCPFCGEESEVYVDGVDGGKPNWVECRGCGTYGPEKQTTRQAIVAWNRRAGKAVAELERVRPLLKAIQNADARNSGSSSKTPWFRDEGKESILRAALAYRKGEKK
jgi:Lar family restriction alleviation protein